ncbi:MAG: MFS transporter [Burkholderiales bacterium]
MPYDTWLRTRDVIVTTSYRNIFLLACCQALLLTNASGLISMNALVGFSLTDVKTLATLGATTYVLGSAFTTMPMSLWMGRVGRRRGFMAGALINIAGCGIAVTALSLHSFVLYCVGTAVIGVYNAVGLQYRFAAAEVAAPKDRARAISLVLAGGIVGGFLGPAITRWGRDLFAAPFLGSFAMLAAVALAALAVQWHVHVPKPSSVEQAGGGRPLSAIVRQPVFFVAAIAAALGYGLMNLLMTATPLAMDFCSLPYSQAAFVISWHVVGMYAPGFVTGSLIDRFGILPVILGGIAVLASGALVALAGNTFAHFLVALVLVGVGWNFMYTGGTTLLTQSYTPAEKSRTQGLNDFIVFSTMALSSFSSGALVSSAGWEIMNWAALPLLALVAGVVLWYMRHRRRHALQVA